MIYTVKMQADSSSAWVDIYGTTKALALLTPKVKAELNSAGSFDFVIPPGHTYYASPKIMLTNVAVYEENRLIFFGRVTEIEVDFYKQKTIHVEGALAFFNDTIQRPAEFDTTTVRSFVNYIVAKHNEQAATDRQFIVRNIDDNIGNKTIYRKLDYETTFDCIKKMCLEAEGGYIFIEAVINASTGRNYLYLDWLEGLETSGNEPIQYAVNLVDLKQTYTIDELYTSVIPLGKEIEDPQTGVSERLTIASVNSGLDYLNASQTVLNQFGRIQHVETFSDIDNATKLKQEGQAWLNRQDFNQFSVEVSAADLHYINSDYEAWKLGQNIRVLSVPHLIDVTLPLTKLDVDLSKAVKQVTVGTKKKETLTEIYKDKTKEYVK